MVKTETSNEEVVILLTGEEWGDKRFTTVRAKVRDSGYEFEDTFVCDGDCPTDFCLIRGEEVPYMIGQKVRLTGSEYEKFIGEETEVVKYRVSGGSWVAVLKNRIEVYSDDGSGEDWSVTPIEGDPKTPPLEDWEARLVERDKEEKVRKEVEDGIVAYLRRVETEIRDDIQEMLYARPNPDLARLKGYAAEVYAYGNISEIVATGEYRD